MKAIALLGLLALGAPASAARQASAPAPTRFRAVVLETTGQAGSAGNEEATAINASGETAGRVFVGDSAHAAYWSVDGELTVLGTTGGCSFSSAGDISDLGVVVGTSVVGAPDNAFLWTAATGMGQLPLPPKCYPAGIDMDGTIAFTAIPPVWQVVGATWNPAWGARRITLAGGEVYVRDLSDVGAVAGIASFASGTTHAFRWSPEDGLVDLGAPPGFPISQGSGINDHGVVVGLSRSPLSDQATRWEPGLAPVLLPYARPLSTQAAAYAINDAGWIVGAEYEQPPTFPRASATLWVDGVAHDLTSLVVQPPGSPFVHVSIAWDVNDQGQIAARGLVDGVERALRLDRL